MKIQIEYVAMLDVQGPRSGSTMEVPGGATVGDVLNALKLDASHQRSVSAFVNEERATSKTALKEGDKVFLALPISGG